MDGTPLEGLQIRHSVVGAGGGRGALSAPTSPHPRSGREPWRQKSGRLGPEWMWGVRWPGLRVRGRLWGHPGTGAVPTDPSLVPPPPNPINGQICVMEQTGSHRTYISSLLWPCRDDILQNSRTWRAARRGGSVRNVLQTPPSCGATGELRSGPQS